MLLDRMTRTLLAATALGFAAAPAFAADYVVVESSVPALAAGSAVASDQPLDLGANARVVLLNSSGQMMTVTGPFKGPPPAAKDSAQAAGGDTVKLVANLLAGHTENQLGAVRGVEWRADAVKTAPDALAVDASSGNEPDMCVFDPRAAEIIHDPGKAGAMTVQSMSTGAEAKVQWQKDMLRQPWPAALQLTDGDILTFVPDGAEQAVTVNIHVLPPQAGASDVERALQMAREGCNDQAKSLLTVTAKSAK